MKGKEFFRRGAGFKRALALLLSLVMALGLMPADVARAAEAASGQVKFKSRSSGERPDKDFDGNSFTLPTDIPKGGMSPGQTIDIEPLKDGKSTISGTEYHYKWNGWTKEGSGVAELTAYDSTVNDGRQTLTMPADTSLANYSKQNDIYANWIKLAPHTVTYKWGGASAPNTETAPLPVDGTNYYQDNTVPLLMGETNEYVNGYEVVEIANGTATRYTFTGWTVAYDNTVETAIEVENGSFIMPDCNVVVTGN